MIKMGKNWRRDQTHLPLLPRTTRAAEPIAECAEHAGWTLLLRTAGEDRRHFFSLTVKIITTTTKFGAGSKTYPPIYPAPPEWPNPSPNALNAMG